MVIRLTYSNIQGGVYTMKNKYESIPFQDSPEKRNQLNQILADYKEVPGALVQVLKKAQDILSIVQTKKMEILLPAFSLTAKTFT